MYYYNQVATDIEDLLMDFLVYRKNKKGMPLQMQTYQMDHAKQLQQSQPQLEALEAPQEPPKTKLPPIKDMLPPPLDLRDGLDEDEVDYVEALMNEVNREMIPYVHETLNEYEYEGSPIYGEMDRETINQLVDKTLEKAEGNVPAVDEIVAEAPRQMWYRYLLLRSVVEALILGELFYRRRRLYRKVALESLEMEQ